MSSLLRDVVLLGLAIYARIDDPTSRSLWYICAESTLRRVSHLASCVQYLWPLRSVTSLEASSAIALLERRDEIDLHLKGPSDSINRLVAGRQVRSEMYLWHGLAISKLALSVSPSL